MNNDTQYLVKAMPWLAPSRPAIGRYAHKHLRHLFRYLPKQPGYNKRLRGAAGLLLSVIRALAVDTTLWTDDVWVVDSTPVECGRSLETAKRSDLAGWAEYGYCASHSRYFCTPAGRAQARKGEPGRPGARFCKPLRQTVESIFQTLKGQLDLERHGGRTVAGVIVRVVQRPGVKPDPSDPPGSTPPTYP